MKIKLTFTYCFILCLWLAAGCKHDRITIEPHATLTTNPTRTEVPVLQNIETPIHTATSQNFNVPSESRLPPEEWRDWPVIPVISNHVHEIYETGIELGNNPEAFSKIGDCQNVISLFLGVFDRPGSYTLGDDYEYLQPTIDHFSKSWLRQSMAGFYGFNAASELNPIFSDPKKCLENETPIACEIRIQKPIIAIISLETWWGNDTKDYEKYMRQILDYTISKGVIPILGTKADNEEGDNSINYIIAKLAYEYDVPMWNFWAAVQGLPAKGLDEDGFHLTFGQNRYDNEFEMQSAWPWRNLTALQSIHAVWSFLQSQ